MLLLAGCQSEEEKAEEFYQSALTYLEQQDVERSLIELRNVFIHDGHHKDARMLYARLQQERGNTTEAYGQYLRLIEQYPDIVEAREALAGMALERRNWDEATRHGEAAIALDPTRIGTRAIATALQYRSATLARDPEAQATAVSAAKAVLDEDPSQSAARRVVIDALLMENDAEAALTQVDKVLEYTPNSGEFNMLRGQLLAQLNRAEALGDQLRKLYELFPENEAIRADLIRWYLNTQDFDGAEGFLRSEAGAPDEDTTGNLTVVDLLRRTQGPEAAAAELDRLIEAAGESAPADLYRAMRASIDFDSGSRDSAIAAIRAVLDGAEANDQTHRIRIILARMLAVTGNPVGAREQVEQVLGEDHGNVDALKMRAAWLVADDRPGDAVIDLRTALDQAPRDSSILMLMADAFLRDGSEALAQERLSMAVQVSENGAQESVTYARFLIARNRLQQAETVLTSARQRAPQNIEVLRLLGDIYLRQQKWPQAQGVIDALRDIATPQAVELSRVYQSGILLGQNRIDEGLDYLRAQIDAENGGNLGAVIQLVRTQVITGRFDEALGFIDAELAKTPDSIPLQLLNANIFALQGDLTRAETIYRDLLSRQPDIEPAILQLQALLRATDRSAEAETLVTDSIKVLPGSRRLRLLEAHRLEQTEQYEKAIALYEQLYEEQSSDVVVANNLASMLSNYRDTPEDLDRAYAIARRLTGTQVPAFRDTLGWILFLRGDTEAGLEHLQPAAEAMPEEASVIAHLGVALAAAGRTDDARDSLQRALDMAKDTDAVWKTRAMEALQQL
ncbi:tetratricopeptide repeat protein [Salipiger sp. 1_MG-2023]|uniref:tetratricopeptide repeat protein n=1 Tax=Salipiger sp. 1_MG-2023 TaxID=3062665 RepID=UPI0026E41BCE|nr:tetratricopeptide repeat protein [Salipiger sp. 1_MG-2023]MDO6587005.1 tetratricopeptide repeat protein [Salipiger sp. 1_MG-2023]